MKVRNKIIIVLMSVLSVFLFSSYVKADELEDWSDGDSGNASDITKDGTWYTDYVGLKINIITKGKTLQKSKIFVNKKCTSCKYATKNSKLLAASDYSVKWKKKSENYASKFSDLPDNWCTNSSCSKTLNIYDWLTEKSNKNLKALLEKMIGSLSEKDLINYYDSYILVEPMVRIGSYYGTAFELGKSFLNLNQFATSDTFAYNYSKNVFGGNANGGAKLLYNTIYVSSEIEAIGVKNYKKWLKSSDKYGEYGTTKYPEYVRRNYCITRGRTCGRAMGVFSFNNYKNYYSLTINKEFTHKAEVTKNVVFNLQIWEDDEWNNTGKSCTATINKNTGEGECTINGLPKGTYRAIEKDFSSSVWDIECASGCTNSTSASPIKISLTSTKSITVKNKKKEAVYKLTINKTDNNDEPIKNNQALFDIYSGFGCKNLKQSIYTNSDGVATLTNLSGQYSFKEKTAPTGYEKDETCYNVDSSNKTFTIKNTATCQSEFNAKKDKNGKVSISNRISIYKKHPENRNLLNSNKVNASDACSEYTPTYTKTIDCLSSSLDNGKTFSGTDLSNYNEEVTFDISGTTVVGYCLTTMNFSKKLSNLASFDTFAGGILVKESLATQLQLNKNCYLYNESDGYSLYTSTAPQADKTFEYYVSNVKLGNTNLIFDDSSDLSYLKKENNLYGFSITKDYNTPEIYAKNGSGEITNSNCENCKFLGNGIKTNLNQATGGNLEFTYDSKFKSDFSDWTNHGTGLCPYNVTPKLIKNNKLYLEFRTISTSNPFPGKLGNNRNVGSNWCTNDTCESDFDKNSIINSVINERPNSYGIKPSTNEKVTPKYIIELTPTSIEKIREDYNKGNEYSDYNLECIENGNTCISYFLTNLKNDGIISKLENDKRPKFES